MSTTSTLSRVEYDGCAYNIGNHHLQPYSPFASLDAEPGAPTPSSCINAILHQLQKIVNAGAALPLLVAWSALVVVKHHSLPDPDVPLQEYIITPTQHPKLVRFTGHLLSSGNHELLCRCIKWICNGMLPIERLYDLQLPKDHDEARRFICSFLESLDAMLRARREANRDGKVTKDMCKEALAVYEATVTPNRKKPAFQRIRKPSTKKNSSKVNRKASTTDLSQRTAPTTPSTKKSASNKSKQHRAAPRTRKAATKSFPDSGAHETEDDDEAEWSEGDGVYETVTTTEVTEDEEEEEVVEYDPDCATTWSNDQLISDHWSNICHWVNRSYGLENHLVQPVRLCAQACKEMSVIEGKVLANEYGCLYEYYDEVLVAAQNEPTGDHNRDSCKSTVISLAKATFQRRVFCQICGNRHSANLIKCDGDCLEWHDLACANLGLINTTKKANKYIDKYYCRFCTPEGSNPVIYKGECWACHRSSDTTGVTLQCMPDIRSLTDGIRLQCQDCHAHCRECDDANSPTTVVCRECQHHYHDECSRGPQLFNAPPPMQRELREFTCLGCARNTECMHCGRRKPGRKTELVIVCRSCSDKLCRPRGSYPKHSICSLCSAEGECVAASVCSSEKCVEDHRALKRACLQLQSPLIRTKEAIEQRIADTLQAAGYTEGDLEPDDGDISVYDEPSGQVDTMDATESDDESEDERLREEEEADKNNPYFRRLIKNVNPPAVQEDIESPLSPISPSSLVSSVSSSPTSSPSTPLSMFKTTTTTSLACSKPLFTIDTTCSKRLFSSLAPNNHGDEKRPTKRVKADECLQLKMVGVAVGH